MESRPDPTNQADDSGWSRFYVEIFSLRASSETESQPLVSKLASEGVELIVDARGGNETNPAMAAYCEGAGMYYVPALSAGSDLGLSPGAAERYAKLAMRHKTCFVVDENSDELLDLVAEQVPFTAVPLDHEADAPGEAGPH